MANSRLLAVLDSLDNNKLLGVSVSHSNSSWRAGLDSHSNNRWLADMDGLDTRLKFNLKEALLLVGLHTNLQTKL